MPAFASAPVSEPDLVRGYLAYLARTGRGNRSYDIGARWFLQRWRDPATWAAEPLPVRLEAANHVRPFINYLMLHRYVQPGYDYLLERKLSSILREAPNSPLSADMESFLRAAAELGYAPRPRAGMASQIVMRLLIQSGLELTDLGEADFNAFEIAVAQREAREGRPYKHYRDALHGARTVIYHLAGVVEPREKRNVLLKWSWEAHLDGAPAPIQRAMAAYLECCVGTRKRSTVSHMASRLAHFGRFLASIDPEITSLASLERQRHIEPYLSTVAAARHRHTGAPLSASERRARILTVSLMFADIAEWGWTEAPTRRLLFGRDVPRLPQPLPRYLPPDHDRRVVEELEKSDQRLRADALLLQRATGLRVGELLDLELDCVHEVPGQGSWLKVPLGKLDTERMVPLDEETVALVDRIASSRSPGRPLRHPNTGKLVEFLLTHQGRRLSRDVLGQELARAGVAAGIGVVTTHQLRHTYATALVNAGVSLQALMALLGHRTAEMSLRYGRLFDATVRNDYERALTLAKERMGPVMPTGVPIQVHGDWRQAPLIKARMAGGYCVRTAAQGTCPYTNICEHCPNYRSDTSFLPILAAQRTDAEALAADAEKRGWGEEVARHRRLVARLDALMEQAQAG